MNPGNYFFGSGREINARYHHNGHRYYFRGVLNTFEADMAYLRWEMCRRFRDWRARGGRGTPPEGWFSGNSDVFATVEAPDALG